MSRSFSISKCDHVLFGLDGGKDCVRYFLGVGDFVLSVEEVPHVEETIHASQEEKASTSLGPATVS